jgi:hypothetical protein
MGETILRVHDRTPKRALPSERAKSFRVTWALEPSYGRTAFLEDQPSRVLTPNDSETEDDILEDEGPVQFPAWIVRIFAVGLILFLIGLAGMMSSLAIRRSWLENGGVGIAAIGMIILGAALLKARDSMDKTD